VKLQTGTVIYIYTHVSQLLLQYTYGN